MDSDLDAAEFILAGTALALGGLAIGKWVADRRHYTGRGRNYVLLMSMASAMTLAADLTLFSLDWSGLLSFAMIYPLQLIGWLICIAVYDAMLVALRRAWNKLRGTE